MKTRQTQPPDSLGAAPCSVELTKREVIERKLLTALEDDNTVAILASKQDLDVMVAALEYAMLGKPEQTREAIDLAAGMKQLRREAFPPNVQGEGQPPDQTLETATEPRATARWVHQQPACRSDDSLTG